MSSYGREIIDGIDLNSTQVLSDGHDADWVSVGRTIDWSLIAAPVAETTLTDGQVMPAGVKFLRYGQIMADVTATGKIGPHLTNALDGRQTLEGGKCYVLNRTLREDEIASDHAGELFDGGRIWEARLLVGGANEPTLAQVKAAFPRLSYTRDL